MGLGSSTPKTYLSVSDGKIVKRVEEGTPGAVSRTTKSGKVLHELKFSYVSGILTDIRIRENEFNGNLLKSWALTLVDGGEQYQLEIHYDSSWASTMLNALANPVIDFSKPLTFSPWQKQKPDGKYTRCLYVNQGEGKDNSIPWMNPNGLPPMVEVMLNGKKQWDSYERMQFLENMVQTEVRPKLISENMAAVTSTVPTAQDGPFEGQQIPTVSNQNADDEDDDELDLPFN